MSGTHTHIRKFFYSDLKKTKISVFHQEIIHFTKDTWKRVKCQISFIEIRYNSRVNRVDLLQNLVQPI